MPLLATFLASLFSVLFNLFGRFFVLEKAARLAAWGVAFSLMTVLVASVFSCVNGACAAGIRNISLSHINFAVGLGVVFNPTTLAAVGCYMSVWIVCQLYVIKKKAINIVVGGS